MKTARGLRRIGGAIAFASVFAFAIGWMTAPEFVRERGDVVASYMDPIQTSDRRIAALETGPVVFQRPVAGLEPVDLGDVTLDAIEEIDVALDVFEIDITPPDEAFSELDGEGLAEAVVVEDEEGAYDSPNFASDGDRAPAQARSDGDLSPRNTAGPTGTSGRAAPGGPVVIALAPQAPGASSGTGAGGGGTGAPSSSGGSPEGGDPGPSSASGAGVAADQALTDVVTSGIVLILDPLVPSDVSDSLLALIDPLGEAEEVGGVGAIFVPLPAGTNADEVAESLSANESVAIAIPIEKVDLCASHGVGCP